MANTGDVVLVGASRASGDLWPRIRLYQPGGQLLQDEDDPTHAEFSQALPVDGTYSIHISDGFNGTLTGGYGLYLQRLNNPGNATALSFGQTTTSFISQAAEMDTFTFDAQEGDAILVGISRASGDLWPEIRLYDPEGTLVGVDDDAYHAEVTLVVSQRHFTFLPLLLRNHGSTTVPAEGTQEETWDIRFRASLPGTYTILAADGFNGTWTGGYGLHVQRLNNPGNATALAYGDLVAASINMAAEMDAYTFAGSAGDTILISMARTSGNLWPQIRLFDPDGEPIGSDEDATLAELNATLAKSGTYTILVADGFNGTWTGGYDLQLEKTAQ